jgi:hypothetical protein
MKRRRVVVVVLFIPLGRQSSLILVAGRGAFNNGLDQRFFFFC